MTPVKYRKKPVEVEVVLFKGGSASAAGVVKWILSHGGQAHYETVNMDTVEGMIGIKTLEGQMWATPGDYVIRGVEGEFYPCKPHIFEQTYEMPLLLSKKNRKIIERAFDDGEGHGVTLVPTDDYPWFAGVYEGSQLYLGMEHEGTLYSIVHASGGGLCSVIIGRGLLENEMGVALHGIEQAKAYVQGLTAAK